MLSKSAEERDAISRVATLVNTTPWRELRKRGESTWARPHIIEPCAYEHLHYQIFYLRGRVSSDMIVRVCHASHPLLTHRQILEQELVNPDQRSTDREPKKQNQGMHSEFSGQPPLHDTSKSLKGVGETQDLNVEANYVVLGYTVTDTRKRLPMKTASAPNG